MKIIKLFSYLLLFICFTQCSTNAQNLPNGFVYLDSIAPSITYEMRYLSKENFVGDTVDGYLAHRCILSKNAALAIIDIQNELKKEGLGLKVFDAYRPQQAVNHFVRWAKDLSDTIMKQIHYPDVKKSELFEKGYIAEKSGHSRGSSIDLTLIYTSDPNIGHELDMGSPWDYFSPISWPSSNAVSAEQKANRMKLQAIMVKYGFIPYNEEWWHFTFKDEAFPDTYFDFPIK